VVIGLTFYLFSIARTGFIPDEDQGWYLRLEAQQELPFKT
jgi:hypothetical protein